MQIALRKKHIQLKGNIFRDKQKFNLLITDLFEVLLVVFCAGFSTADKIFPGKNKITMRHQS